VAGLASVDPTCPLHLWDRILPQAEITLNLLWTSRLHSQLSAAAHFHGLVDYNKTSFPPPGCKIIAHKKPGKRRTWAPHGQHGYLLGPAMHHYRCQNIYISATVSEYIEDTLEIFPHNYQMPQLSSKYRLLMAANEMSNALQHPHPEVPFTHVGDDTMSTLTALASIFKLKFEKIHIPIVPASPAKVAERTCPAKSSNTISTSPVPQPRQTISQTPIHAQEITNTPLLLRVVTPMSSQPRSQNLAPRNLSQDDFYGMDTAHMSIALGNHHWSQHHQAHAFVHPHHRKRNGIHGPHERPPSTTTLDTRFWQRSWTPFSRH
jgi:hypothetical protein